MNNVDIDLDDKYDKPVFDISWLNNPDKYVIDLGDIENVELLTVEETRENDRARITTSLMDFLSK